MKKRINGSFFNYLIMCFLYFFLSGCKKDLNIFTRQVKDIDGNQYTTVTIGTQVWMAENLKVTKFNDGTPIEYASSLKSTKGWPIPNYGWYNDDPTSKNVFGALYNYRVVHPKGLVQNSIAPKGWHIPSDEEWNTLISYLGGNSIAGGKMKSIGNLDMNTGLWCQPNTGATNESGFSALPGGAISNLQSFFSYNQGYDGFWWSSTYTQWNPSSYNLKSASASIVNENNSAFNSDFMSIRCIKD